MIRVKEVKLKNFRCHEDFALDLNRPTSLIIGANGSGKTSILEAIYLALRGKSFKGVDREIEKEGGRIQRQPISPSRCQWHFYPRLRRHCLCT